MRPIHAGGRVRAAFICAALAACLALPAAASADTTDPNVPGAVNVTVSPTVHVSAKVVATVDISFTCEPFQVFDWQTGTLVPSTVGHLEFGGITLTQAQGRSIASGGNEFEGGTVVCDGTTVTNRSVSIVATTLPWKSGTALASARVNVYADDFESRDFGESSVVVKLGK